ncbi:MAG TPA: DNA polymerase [Bacteroidales bacterium]|nr:DNA polymerase [Bacteroidales bacterium]
MKNVHYICTSTKFDQALIMLERQKLWAFDTETNTLDPHEGNVLLIQIGDENDQFVFNCFLLQNKIKDLLKFLKNTGCTLIGHNAKFDYEMIKGHYGIDLDTWKDTMLAEQLLNQGKSKVRFNLDAVLEKYLYTNVNKAITTSFADMKYGQDFSEEQINYAAQDVEFLIPLYNKLDSLLSSRSMQNLAALEFGTLVATGDLEYNGIFINKQSWLALQGLAETEAQTIRVKLDTHFNPFCEKDLFGSLSINYNSPKQISPILEKICKMKITSTADAALSMHEEEYPVIKDLLEYRRAVKKISTYGETFINENVHPVTDRIHSDFMQLGADSGRFASRNPNMNNIPKQQAYRTPFQAQDPDWRIISADFSQQELRLLAHLSREPRFIEALEKNLDLHCYTGSFIYNIPYEKFFNADGSRNKEMDIKYRNPVKSINFGK